jgi:hypothetical protein
MIHLSDQSRVTCQSAPLRDFTDPTKESSMYSGLAGYEI